MTNLEKIIKNFSRLPGIGRKSAARITYWLLKSDPNIAHQLGEQLQVLHSMIKKCSICGNYTEQDPCPICSNPGRDRSLMCVVENPQDVSTIEETREYNGIYHVLGGAISPMNGIGSEDLSIGQLMKRVSSEPVSYTHLTLPTN